MIRSLTHSVPSLVLVSILAVACRGDLVEYVKSL